MGNLLIKLCLIILSILFVNSILFAQDFYKINYNTKNGLPSSEIYHVFQDSKGYLWFSTNQGVSCFNGYEFNNFDVTDNLPSNTVFEAYEDYKGRIWFTTLTDNLFYFKDNRFTNYKFNDTLHNFRLANNHTVAKSTFYVDSLDNIYYTRDCGKTFIIDASGNPKWSDNSEQKTTIIKIRNDGSILYNYTNSYLSTYIENNYGQFIKLDLPPEFKSNITTHSLVTDNYIILSKNNVVYLIDRQNGQYKKFDFPNSIIWLSIDKDQVLWIGTYRSGIMGFKEFNLKQPTFHLLKDLSVSSICKDTEGGYWLSTLKNGAYYFPSLNVKVFSKGSSIKAKAITTVCDYDNKIWFAGDSPYLYSFDKEIKEWNWFAGFGSDFKKMAWLNNQLVATLYLPRAMSYMVNPTTTKHEVLRDFYINYTVLDNGEICFSTPNHQYHTLKNGQYKIHYLPEKLPLKYIFDLCQDSLQNIWFATERGLVIKKNDKYIAMADSNKLLGTRINCIVNHNNTIWMGSKGAGLFCKTKDTLINYTTRDGIPSNSINKIIFKHDTVWLSTNNGVARFVGHPVVGKVELWSTANGLTDNEINDLNIFKNVAYVATQNGLCYFPTTMSGISKTPPPIYINHIGINNRDTTLQRDFKLNYQQNSISISFTGIAFKKNKGIDYRYRLFGIENTFSITKQREVRYAQLPPGKYKLQVFAINNFGIESSYPAEINIIIAAPFWKTLWFRILTVLLLIALTVLISTQIFLRRMNRLKKQNAYKQELNKYRQQALSSQMNPHFLYNSINSAQYFILNNSPNMASDYLSNLGSLMRIVLDNSMHETITLFNELDALYLYIEMEQRRFHECFVFSKEIDPKIDLHKTKVPPLILQPYVENAIHHGLRLKKGKQELKLKLYLKQECLVIEIEDNGVGRFNDLVKIKNDLHVSLGTNITERRLRVLEEVHSRNITVEIKDLYQDSNQSAGTNVILKIKRYKSEA